MFGLTKLFGKKEEADPKKAFWNWFAKNEHRFRNSVNDMDKAHGFLDDLLKQMKPFNPWLKALAGPYGDERFELIITADGDIALFCKVEELVESAPVINGWLITAHKPAIGMEKMSINMFGYKFSSDNMSFSPLKDENYPDEINIVIVHPDFTENEKADFHTAAMIFLENSLGELNTATIIDKYEVRGIPSPVDNAGLVPMAKLEDYLKWREKEFVEKYASLDGSRPPENWTVLEAEDGKGKLMFSTIDTGFKNWEYRSAYPWLVQIDIDYKSNENGLPDKKQMQELQQMEDEISGRLQANIPVLLIGHHSYENRRSIFYYTADHTGVSKIIHHCLDNTVIGYKTAFFVRKDKYWQNMSFFFDAIDE
jgi:hypothetical protein